MNNHNKTIIMYCLAQNHTRSVATKIAANLNADIFEIEPAEPYTEDDFTDKTVIPFCTSHSSGLDSSDTNLHSKTTTGNPATAYPKTPPTPTLKNGPIVFLCNSITSAPP